MDRHRVAAAVASAVLVVALAGCGGSSASPSPGPTGAPTDEPVPSDAPRSAAPSDAAASPIPAANTTATALCAGVGVRKTPASDGSVLVRVKAGTKVRVAAVVMGDAYTAGSCGVSGNSWLKVDRIGGKSVKTLDGVPFGDAAAGFFR